MIFYGKSKEMRFAPDNNKLWLDYLLSVDGKKLVVNIDRETGIRTGKQNNSLHLFFEHFAKELNDAGLDMKKVLKPHVDISWTKDSVKEYLWKPLQEAITGKVSTKSLDKTSEIGEVYERLVRHFSEKFGMEVVPFPHEDKKVEPPQNYPTSDESNTPNQF